MAEQDVNKKDIVYRALRQGELETILAGQGICRPIGGRTTPTQHVMGIKHPSNPWISTTRRIESAEFFATHGNMKPPGPIVIIDLLQVQSSILDISTQKFAEQRLKHPRTVNFAVKHQEVLICEIVNPEAIIGIVGGNNER
jgi:hypothetical protein